MNKQAAARLSFRTLAVSLAASLTLIACGGGGGDDDTAGAAPQPAGQETIAATLTGDQEAPARVDTAAFGSASFKLDRTTRTLSGTVSVDGVEPTLAHIHGGEVGTAGPVIFPMTIAADKKQITLAPTVLTQAQLDNLDAGKWYVNVHSAARPDGEIRGQMGREVYTAVMTGGQLRLDSAGSGSGALVLDPKTSALSGEFEVEGLTATLTDVRSGAAGSKGNAIFSLEDHGGHGHFTVPANTVLNAKQVENLRKGGWYVNAHTAARPDGELRGQIGRRVLLASATGAQEVPANGSAATGFGFVAYDHATRKVEGRFTPTGMTATIAHIHMAPAGVNGPVIVGLAEATAGSGLWDVPANTTLTAAQAEALFKEGLYFNAHSAAFANGEVRGQIQPR